MAKLAFDCVVFDLDGVITKTAKVHAKAWKATFDEYMRMRETRNKEPFREFTHEGDYLPYVDGKPRYEGVKSFLESRKIFIDFGDPTDTPDKETVCGIGNRKNQMFTETLKSDGAEVFEASVEFIKNLKKQGIKIGVASSSKNCQPILQSAGLDDLFETRVDGVVSAEMGLKGKPEGDIFVTACRNLGCEPANTIVVEDATSGVAAGRNGGFGLVLGIAREDNVQDLLDNGADLVVKDLADISIEQCDGWFKREPAALFDNWQEFKNAEINTIFNGKIVLNFCNMKSAKEALLNGKRLVIFLDYDGTLTPIVDKPELAVLSKEMRETVKNLSKIHTVAIVSGRMRADVQKLVNIDGLFYAGSHGHDIEGPNFSLISDEVKDIVPTVDKVIERLKKELGDIEGVLVEEKKFSTAVHYRLVDEVKSLHRIQQCVEKVVEDTKGLRLMHGKKVFELLPDIEWDKGKAIRWIMQALKIKWEEASVVYIGDDTTDEFAFRAIRTRGTGIYVAEENKPSAAHFHLKTPDDVKKLFEDVIRSS